MKKNKHAPGNDLVAQDLGSLPDVTNPQSGPPDSIQALTAKLLDHFGNDHPDPDMTECKFKADVDAELVALVAAEVAKARLNEVSKIVVKRYANMLDNFDFTQFLDKRIKELKTELTAQAEGRDT